MLPKAKVGTTYTQVFAASAGASPFKSWFVEGSLPAGLRASHLGVVSGTPLAAGTFRFSVVAQDGGRQTVSRLVTITVN